MAFEISGKIIEIFREQQVSERFKKREFVIETKDGNFSELIKFQLVQDSTDLIDPYKTGDEVKVFFNIKGNKWKENYFVNLQAWRISKASGETNITESNPDFEDAPPPPGEDEMPF